MSIVLSILTFVLVLISLLMVLVILMQRAKSDGGVGAALGGGMVEGAFGAEGGNVLSKATETGAIIFFVLGFMLYLGNIYIYRHGGGADGPRLPDMPAPLEAPGALPDLGGLPAISPEAPPTDVPATEAPATGESTTPAPSPGAESAPVETSVPAETPPGP